MPYHSLIVPYFPVHILLQYWSMPAMFNKVPKVMLWNFLEIFTICCYLLEKQFVKISAQFLFWLSFSGHSNFLGLTGYFCFSDFSHFHRLIISNHLFQKTPWCCLIILHKEHQKFKPNEAFNPTFFNDHLKTRKKPIKWTRADHFEDF